MEEIRIKELGEIYTGKTPPTANSQNFGPPFPFVTPVDLVDDKYIRTTERYVSNIGIKHTTLIPSNSVCVSCIGYIGKIGITTSDSCTNQQINSIVVNEEYFIDYVYYLLSYNVPYFKELAGVNVVPQLNKSDFSKVKLQATKNKTEQTAIAAILSKVDEAIEATQNSIKAAEKLKKALMQNLLTGKLKPDGPDSYRERTDDEFYVDEKFGKVPKGWEIKKLKEVALCLDSKRKPIKAEDRKLIQGKYPYYGAAGIIDHINDYIFDGRYLLFGEDGENLISRKVPQAFIVDGKFWVNNHAHILKEIENVSDLDFLCFSLESKNYENIVYGSAQPKINKSDLYKIKILIPLDLIVQEQIAKKLNDSESLIAQKQTKIRTLQRLKKSLMQNLLTGKVRLSQAFIEQFESGMSGNPTNQANQRILNDE